MAVGDLLLSLLKKLEEAELKEFKWHLVKDHERISKSEMENVDRLDTVNKIVACFTPEEEAVKITVDILRKMNQNRLAEWLEKKYKQGSSSDDIIRWNRSSVKYRSKIEELRKDSSRKKVGNIYFSKSNNYKIGSGGSGTVYLGLKADGTGVAIKRIIKDQQESKTFENELKHLQDLSLESKNIVRYVDLAEDEDFYYLALQLCEYDLEDYMEIIRQEEQKDKDTTLRKIVEEVLRGLQVLHRAGVIHRDIKPGNVLIDSRKNARLADFGLSHKLEEGRSTVHTARAGTIGWEATEILNHHTGYKKSSDIQVAGMLVYYILSDGKHPFGDMKDREENIKKGQYFLKHLQDIVAKDLVDGMIKKDPAKRLTIDEVLDHPYFWDDDRRSQMKTAHILDVSGASVHPKEGITPRRETDPNFFEIKTSLGNDLKMTLIREEDKKIVWTAMTEKDELDQIHPQREESRLKSEADKARYFNEHWSDLIQRVTNVKIIADKLLQQRLIHEEQYSEIKVSLTSQEGMRKICDIVRKHSDAEKAKLISILQEEKLFHF